MTGYHQVETAAQIGMLTRERDSAAACGEALRLLSQVLPTDASTVMTRDPFTGRHHKLAGIECPERAAGLLAREFVDSPWYLAVLTAPLPPAASAESGQGYRRGWFFQEFVRPAGFRDAMSGALRSQGRYVGMVHLSAERTGAFTTEARQLLASFLPALATLADACSRVGQFHDLASDAPAALFTGGRVADLPGRERPGILEDNEFRLLLHEFTEAGGQWLRLLWPAGHAWYRVILSRHQLPGCATQQVTLVSAQPIAVPYGLSPRELDVLTRTALGQTNQAIADELFVSPRTVHTHVEHVLRKTGTASRAQAAALAMRDGLLRPAAGTLTHFIH